MINFSLMADSRHSSAITSWSDLISTFFLGVGQILCPTPKKKAEIGWSGALDYITSLDHSLNFWAKQVRWMISGSSFPGLTLPP